MDSVNPLSINNPTTVTLENLQVAMMNPLTKEDKADIQSDAPEAGKQEEPTKAAKKASVSQNNNSTEVQAQLQMQLQNTIRQHLLDPVRYPLPPSIAQLLPQAIAQLPPQLATQLSSTLNSTLKTKSQDKENKPVQK